MILKYRAIDLAGNLTCLSCSKKLGFGQSTKIVCIALPGRSWVARAATGAALHRCDVEIVLWCDRCARVESSPMPVGRRRRSRHLACRTCRSPLRHREL